MVDAVALNEGVITARPITAGATVYMTGQQPGTPAAPDNRIWVGGMSDLTVECQMTGAVAGDLIPTVEVYQADGSTVNAGMLLPATSQPTPNPAFAGGKCYYYAAFDVSPYDMVRIGFKNNNAGAQTIDRASWRLGSGG